MAYFQPGVNRPSSGYPVAFGKELETSVKRFQKDHKLEADGVVGSQTDRKIDDAYAKAQKRRKRTSALARARARKDAVAKGEL